MPTTRILCLAAATTAALVVSATCAPSARAELTDRAQVVTYVSGDVPVDGDSRESPVRVNGDAIIRVAFRVRGTAASDAALVLNTLGGPSASGFSCAVNASPTMHARQTSFTNLQPDVPVICAASVQLPQGETYWGLVTATFAQGGSRANVSDQIHLLSTTAPTGSDAKFGDMPTSIAAVWALEEMPHVAVTRPSGWQPSPWPGGTRQLADTGVRG